MVALFIITCVYITVHYRRRATTPTFSQRALSKISLLFSVQFTPKIYSSQMQRIRRTRSSNTMAR